MENSCTKSVAEMKAKFEDELILYVDKIQGDGDNLVGVSVSKIKAKFEDNKRKLNSDIIDEMLKREEEEQRASGEQNDDEGNISEDEGTVVDELEDMKCLDAAFDTFVIDQHHLDIMNDDEIISTSSRYGDGELNFVSDVAMSTASEIDSNCEDEFEDIRSYAQLNVSVAELRKFFEIQQNMSSEEAKAKIEEEVSKVYRIYTDETDEKIRSEVSQVADTIYEKVEEMMSLRDTEISSLQNDNNSLKNENVSLQEKIGSFERKIELMAQDVISTKRNTFSNDQYLRQNNIEIDGIPKLEDDLALEGVVTDILQQIDVTVTSESFEACHRLLTSGGGNGLDDTGGTTICRFTNQRICEKIHRNKNKLKNLADSNPSLSKIIIRDNINVYFKDLFVKCNILKQKKQINETWTFKGIPIIKLLNDEVKHITHSYDLERLFPDFNYFEEE